MMSIFICAIPGQQHLLLKIKEDFHKELRFKSSFKHQLFLADAMELRLHLRNEIKSNLAKNIHVKRGMIFSGSGSIFTKYYIKAPVQLIFDRPMLSDGIRKFSYVG